MSEDVEYIIKLKDQMTSGLSQLSSRVDSFESKIRNVNSTASGFGSLFKSAIPFVAGAFAVDRVFAFGRGVVSALSNYEKFQASLSTFLGGNQQQVEALTRQLQNFATTTPFELTEIQEATKRLLAFGVQAGDIESTLRSLGDTSAAINAPIAEIADLYGKAKVQGRLYMTDVNQLTGRGIPVIQELAKQFGVNDDQVKQLVEDGKVGFPEIQKAFASMTSEGGKFFGLMEAQSKTTGGQISNLQDSFDNLKVNIGLLFKEGIGNGVSFLSSIVSKLGDFVNWIRDNFDGLRRVFAPIMNAVRPIVEVFKSLGERLGFASGQGKILENVFNAIGTFLKFISPLLDIIGNVVATTLSSLIDIGKGIFDFVTTTIRFFSGLWSVIKYYFTTIWTFATDVFSSIGDMISGLLSGDFTKVSLGKDSLVNAFANKGKDIADAFLDGYNNTLKDFFGDDKKGSPTASNLSVAKSITNRSVNETTAKTAKDIAGNSKPTNINIRIDNLVREFLVQSTSTSEGASEIKKIIVETLLGAVNNANILATG